MKKLLRSCVLFFTVFYCSSCYRVALSSLGVLDKSVSLEKISNTKKEVVFIPMHHIGKRDFYKDVKRVADSLQNIGYRFYYEGVRISPVKDSLKTDSLRRKMRYVLGADVFALKSQGGYIDTVNHTIFHKKLKILTKEDLVNQPPYIKMGIDTAKSTWADVYLSDMIPEFEKRFENIILTGCDFNTPLNEKYSCSNYKNKNGKNFLLIDYRNESVADKIMNDSNTKIAIIYGSKHYGGVLKVLQQHDSAWKKH
ncbi:MAG: hypothetical protein QM737_13985 [Ferruginibacter sp.]